MVEYPKKFPPLGAKQRLLDDKIIKLTELSLLKEWQKQLIIQVFDSATHELTDIVEFRESLETAKDIFHMQGEGKHKNKKPKQSGECHHSSKSEHRKGSNQDAKHL